MLSPSVVEARLRILLPEQYQETFTTLEPTPMRSAGLVYAEGKVAWDQIWGSFCDLSMAGGPPHRGTLLAPATPANIAEAPTAYEEVSAELCRGLHLVTGLYAEPSPHPGWLRLFCTSATMAAWLARAIVLENISAHVHGLELYLPAGPAFRLEKEIKNVVTATAKTTHYWTAHKTHEQQQAIAQLFREMSAESPLLQPTLTPEPAPPTLRATHPTADFRYPGWLGLPCPDLPTATQLTRHFLATNTLPRREETTVYFPFDSRSNPLLSALPALS